MTSVKDFQVEEPPTKDAPGRGYFLFSDRYSVFDWGEMPDPIPDKGAALCIMGAYHFERLASEGIATHYLGVEKQGEVVPLDEASVPPTRMAIRLTQVPDLPHRNGRYDYDHYHREGGDNYLVPLEIVFRNRVPAGSSLRRRSVPSDHGLPLDGWPQGPVELEEPIVEFSTKYEEKDRYLSREEAARIAGRADLDVLESVARQVNDVVTARASRAGFVHEDGKIECMYCDGEIRVADVVGTFDENRFSVDGQPISKEVVRRYYRSHQPEWIEACGRARRRANKRGEPDWRTLCEVRPRPLPGDVLGRVRDMYAAGTNAFTGRRWFEAPPLERVVQALRELDTGEDPV